MSVSTKFARFCGPLAPSVFFILESMLVLSLFRIAFIIWLWPRVSAVDGLWPVLGFGLRFDLIVICFAIALPVVCSLLLPDFPTLRRYFRRVEAAFLSLCFGIFVYMETATPSYINQYDSRPGRLFFEYLNHPKEVFGTLWASYKLQLFIGLALLILAIWLSLRTMLRLGEQQSHWRLRWRLLAFPLCGVLIFLGARSSLDHRPANLSTASFSVDQLVNRLGVSSTYSLLYAVQNIHNEGRADRLYPKMPVAEMFSQLYSYMNLPSTAFPDKDIPTYHRQDPLQQLARPRNVVIILEESLGADFVGSLGGEDWTPQLDKLRHEGIWFENMYATGTRSVRGIEATTAGLLPSPGRSVVKLGLAQRHFFTLAQLFKPLGYKSSFIYGGESIFDNMRGFFLGNGFDKVVDQGDFETPKFRGTWGVSDEDLFNRADEEFRKMGDKPFFALVFSTSNHEPFDIPSGILKNEQAYSKLGNAVRYSDYALGKFIAQAQKSDYWKNTLFVIVADHSNRVYGNALVPINKFHIPALILGADIKPQVISKIAGQSDLPTTLLSLLGKTTWHPMPGRNLLQIPADDPGHAVMQFNLNHATMVGDQVIVQQPHLPAKQFRYTGGKLVAQDLDPKFAVEASALALWPSYTYFNQQYRLPEKIKPESEQAVQK
ncbi:LTA synthase family protein [Geopsychrobacter electrodiphilus]|uniref:LTA synthase family protein n=1 Tax=Geopsychrobacter electrodiphilus TaxID=225196 RepID=UPI0012ECA566|nr:LTA synthase family protein [Geopsychrobacter electrodiphilus]